MNISKIFYENVEEKTICTLLMLNFHSFQQLEEEKKTQEKVELKVISFPSSYLFTTVQRSIVQYIVLSRYRNNNEVRCRN